MAFRRDQSEDSGDLVMLRSPVPTEETHNPFHTPGCDRHDSRASVPAVCAKWSLPSAEDESGVLSIGHYDLDSSDDYATREVYAIILRGEERAGRPEEYCAAGHNDDYEQRPENRFPSRVAVDGLIVCPGIGDDHQQYQRIGRFSADVVEDWIESAILYNVEIV